jgi:DNA polymerase delta subunit 1
MTGITFQIVNWYTEDVEIEGSDDEDDEDEQNTTVDKAKYIIKMFGVDEAGKSVGCTVTQFTPHFYVKIDKLWNKPSIAKLDWHVRSKIGKKYQNSQMDIKPMKKKDFWGFNNNEDFWYLRFCFASQRMMRQVVRVFNNPGGFSVPGISLKKYKLYESNIDPFLRFIHIRNIQPAGWVTIPAGKYTKDDILPSKCSTDIQATWMNVHPVDKESIAPLLCASFDLECTSSDGDFPVPIKNYVKMATDLYNMYNENQKTNDKDEYELKKVMKKHISTLFEKRMVLPKNQGAAEPSRLNATLTRHIDHMLSIIKGDASIMQEAFKDMFLSCFKSVEQIPMYQNDKSYKSKLQLVQTMSTGREPEKLVKLFQSPKLKDMTSTGKRKYMSACFNNCFLKYAAIFDYTKDPEAITDDMMKLLFADKDGIITTLSTYMSDTLPSLKGDEIIQIGTTFHRYGEQDCSRKVILSLGTCDQLDGIEVVECEDEADMLMKWVDLINTSDPDIITGWNIFGFDYSYLYGRAKELGIVSQFCQMGRLRDKESIFKEVKLSSSALGDNVMKYIEMEGRTLIDLMKVVQRDHKLDSYKLDSVANHFLKMNKHDVSPQDIFRLFKGSAQDRAVVADYCVQDCALCNRLIMSLEIIANNVGMANVCSVPMSWIFMRGQGVKIFSLVAKECKNNGFLVPSLAKPFETKKFVYQEDGADADDAEEVEQILCGGAPTEPPTEEDKSGYEGAIVLEPKTGIYIDTPVAVLDYASLYPSSMISENLSHDCIVLDEKYDNLPGVDYLNIVYDLYEGVGDEKVRVGEKVCRFVQPPNGEKGIIPNILNHLLKQRKLTRKRIGMKCITMIDGTVHEGFYSKGSGKITDLAGVVTTFVDDDVKTVKDKFNQFQKAVLDGLQLAYKVTANSLYGQIGARTSPIYLKDIAACTTATGRKMILLAKEFLETEYHADIVYGDTDSIFATFPNEIKGLTGREALIKSIEIASEASQKVKSRLKHPHDLEYEKTFYPMILFSKKRYCANKYEHDPDKFKQNSMGIVLKRRDNAPIVKTIYGGVIDIILNKHDIKESVRFLKTHLQDLVDGKFPLEDLVITKTLKGHYKDPSKIAHKVLANRIAERQPGNAPQANDRIPYVYVQPSDKKSSAKILQGERIEHPDFIRETKLKPDYTFYITNQIMNPVLQLYALALEQVDGYKLPKDHWDGVRQNLEKQFGESPIVEKKVREKLADMKEEEAKKLLFSPILRTLENKKRGQTEISNFFPVSRE